MSSPEDQVNELLEPETPEVLMNGEGWFRSAMRVLLEIVKKKKGLIVAVLVGSVVYFMPNPGGVQFAGKYIELTAEGQSMLALLAALVVVFLTEALPIGALVGVVYAWVVLVGILPVEEAAPIFSRDAAWFLVGALMMAEVIIKYKIHKRVLGIILRIVGTRTRNVVLGLITFCALAAGFIADHLIVAMMLPIVVAIITEEGGFKKVPKLSKLLLFSVAFGASIGGIATPSGGGRNVVMIGLVKELADISIGFGTWMQMGLPLVLVLIPLLALVLQLRWRPEVTDLEKSYTQITRELKMAGMSRGEWGTIIVFLGVMYLWIWHSDLGIGMIAMLGATLFLVFGLANWRDYQRINWNIPMLYFGALGLGKALELTGAAKWLGAQMLATISTWLPMQGFSLVALQVLIINFFTEIMADGPAVATLGPTLLETSLLTGTDVVVSAVAIAMSSAFAFMLVIGTPANAIIYGSGYCKPKDFLTTGVLIKIISIVLLLLMIRFYWWPLGLGGLSL